MPQVVGIDHIAITVSDLEATCAFCDRLFGAKTHLGRVVEGKVQVRQIALGWCLGPEPSTQILCVTTSFYGGGRSRAWPRGQDLSHNWSTRSPAG
jgi:catechol 2,3-dioxygenase-like lactoylglutathione lyase family enzyme